MSSSHPAKPFEMLIPDAVTLNSKSKPDGPVFVYAKSDPSNDIGTITNLEFARATHRAAQILRPKRDDSDGQVVAFIALSDAVLYQAIVVGLITANLIPFPISPRNSPAAIVGLLRKTSCHRLVATCVTLGSLLDLVKQEMAKVEPDFLLTVEEVPSLSQIYPNLGAETADCAFEPYLAYKGPSLDDICICLHSSGSTGLPKAIFQTHRALMYWASNGVIADMSSYALPHPVAAMPLPSFHLSGIYGQLLHPIYGNIPAAVYPPTATSPDTLPIFPSPDNILIHAQKTNSKVMMILPAVLVLWSKSPEAVAYLKTLSFIGFAGGTLPQRLGDSLREAGVNVRTVYGATEFGTISAVLPLKEDEQEWEWLRISDRVKVRWDPLGDGTYECHVLSWENYSVGVENLEDVRGYATSDLFVNHPVKKHLWKIVARIDDVIVHTSGEKTVPAPMEDIVMTSPYVAGTVMFGREREQAGILIEPMPNLQIDVHNATEVAGLRNKLWPIIEEANKIAPAFSRIFKEMVLFTSAEKPLPRAGKGTVMRKAAIEVYKPEIDALYDIIAENSDLNSAKSPATWDAAGIQGWLLELASDLSKLPVFSPDVDLFHQGFDSLSATFLRLRILSAIRSSEDTTVQRAAETVTQSLIYSYPTISQLSTFIARSIAGTGENTLDPKQLLYAMIAKYVSDLAPPAALPSNSGSPAVVLLTGSTGSLGSHILASLLKDARVTRVYAFNRPSSDGTTLQQRHWTSFSDRGLDTDLLSSPKLVLVEGQISQHNLGLESRLYGEIQQSVTLIIHNAWTLDFNLPLASFEPHIQGTRNLVDLVLGSPAAPSFLFTSSITSALAWDPRQGRCPEALLPEAHVAVGAASGYGQSKFVAEQILARSGLRAACLRIGQVCGALPRGAWATSDWVPIMVKTSIALGRLPRADGLISWIDFDTVAQAIMDVAFAPVADPPERCAVFNVVHPRPVPWDSVMTMLRDAIPKHTGALSGLWLVPFAEWCAALESAVAKTGPSESLPGIKLLDFFRHLSQASLGDVDSEVGGIDFATVKIQALSPAVKSADWISAESVEAWLSYWRASGFI